jgi:cytidylate kinase
MGNAIIVGRAAAVVTQRLPGGIHVRLIGSPEIRLKRMMRFYRLDEAAAREALKTKDAGRRAYVRKYFGKDVDDPLLYHVTVNTDRVPVTAVARLIAAALAAKAT